MEPWMLFYLVQGRAQSWIITEYSLHEVFEFGRDVSRFQCSPVRFVNTDAIAMARLEEVIELIVHLGLAEWEVSNNDGEQNDP